MMKKASVWGLTGILTGILLLTGCSGFNEASQKQTEDIEISQMQSDTEADTGKGGNDEAIAQDDAKSLKQDRTESADQMQTSGTGETKGQVASADEMAEVLDVGDESMTPVTAAQLKDGTYPVKVDCSSTMFKITSCYLTVADGQMSAVMTMSGTGYLYVYMGTGAEAVDADETQYISYVENDSGEHTFTVPVQALDQAVACTAFSRKKEKWYDRQLLFRADSLPPEAFADGIIKSVSELGIRDGRYTVDVKLSGGSGRASVESPTELTVEDGKAYAVVVWSSRNYDYMLVDGERYDNENPDGNSTFVIPVAGFDGKLSVVGDTTAMSTPYEIDYTLYFASDSIRELE